MLLSSWIKLNLKPLLALDFQLHAPLNNFYYLDQFELTFLVTCGKCTSSPSPLIFLLFLIILFNFSQVPLFFLWITWWCSSGFNFAIIYKLDDLRSLYAFSLPCLPNPLHHLSAFQHLLFVPQTPQCQQVRNGTLYHSQHPAPCPCSLPSLVAQLSSWPIKPEARCRFPSGPQPASISHHILSPHPP